MAFSKPVNVSPQAPSYTSFGAGFQFTLTTITANHVYALFQNVGPNDVWINFAGATAAAGFSFLLKANGGTLEFSDYLPTGSVNVWGTGSGGNVLMYLVA